MAVPINSLGPNMPLSLCPSMSRCSEQRRQEAAGSSRVLGVCKRLQRLPAMTHPAPRAAPANTRSLLLSVGARVTTVTRACTRRTRRKSANPAKVRTFRTLLRADFCYFFFTTTRHNGFSPLLSLSHTAHARAHALRLCLCIALELLHGQSLLTIYPACLCHCTPHPPSP